MDALALMTIYNGDIAAIEKHIIEEDARLLALSNEFHRIHGWPKPAGTYDVSLLKERFDETT